MNAVKNAVKNGIQEIIAKELGTTLEAVEGSEAIRDLPNIESIKVLRIVTRIEQRFGVVLEDDVVFRLETVPELVTLVEDRAVEAGQAREMARA